MKDNKYFIKAWEDWSSGRTKPNQAIQTVLRSFYSRSQMSIADDTMPYFDGLLCSSDNVPRDMLALIDFLHRAKCKKFYFADNSTAGLSLLCTLLSLNGLADNGKVYSVTVAGTAVIQKALSYRREFEQVLIIGIAERRH